MTNKSGRSRDGKSKREWKKKLARRYYERYPISWRKAQKWASRVVEGYCNWRR